MIGIGSLVHFVKRRAGEAGRGGAFLGDRRAERAGNLISEHINSGTLFAFMLWIEFLVGFRCRARGTIGTGVAGVDVGALKPPPRGCVRHYCTREQANRSLCKQAMFLKPQREAL